MTILRRILVTAFIAILAALGVFTALLGRRPRRRVATRAEVLVPISAPITVSRIGGGGRSLAVGIVCLLVLLGSAGIIYESRDVLFGGGPQEPGGNAKPLSALSPRNSETTGSPAPPGEMPTGGVRTPAADPIAGSPHTLAHAPLAPDFDVVRVEPNGDAVIAGQAGPNAAVELLVNGKPVANARADAGGHFTLMPPSLPVGNSDVALRATDEKGEAKPSSAHVAVAVAPGRDTKPLVAITTPGKPTLVLSQPVLSQPDARATEMNPADASGRKAGRIDAMVAGSRNASDTGPDLRGSETVDAPGGSPKDPGREDGGSTTGPANAPREPGMADALGSTTAVPPTVVSIDARDGGKLFVTARGTPGAAVRLYLNETMIAPATVGRDGTVTFTVGRGLRPGDYKVRLDLDDPATGKVRDRAEVPFTAPDPGQDEGVEYSVQAQGPARHGDGQEAPGRESSVASSSPEERREGQVRPSTTGSLAANSPPGAGTGSSDVQIPGIETTRIERGDSLWRISRRTYGEGEHYTLIYDANREQIRNPDLIYPGQVFVLPQEHDGEGIDGGRAR